MPILIVRHAHAGSRGAWTGDDDLRPLSAKGRARALALGSLLQGFEPSRLLSSPSLRCLQTLAPLAEATGRSVETSASLGEGNGPAAVELIGALVDERVVVCTHGDVATVVLGACGGNRSGLGAPRRCARARSG